MLQTSTAIGTISIKPAQSPRLRYSIHRGYNDDTPQKNKHLGNFLSIIKIYLKIYILFVDIALSAGEY
ncbi:MAG TPA: hypothetical protein DD638_08625 [Pasteurellaceae bacterium]|nr:hypothetical protein [Pasteurellaceae bacterium]